MKHSNSLHPSYIGIQTLLTIHNLGYQGRFQRSAVADLGLPQTLFDSGVIEHDGLLNFLKSGILFSDRITTVSPTYAREIQTPALGFGLDNVLRSRADRLTGILNGADESWNPATDRDIAARFDRNNLTGKQACKRSLLTELGLPETLMSTPLVGVVSRLVEQKGFDLLMRVPHELAAEGLALAVLGSGEQRFEDFFRWFAAAYPNRIGVRLGYDSALARKITAGSDLFLMPSRYEPCGLNQMYAMRYGTLPVVHATGGLDDTVDPYTGFKFRDETPQVLLQALRRARATYGTPHWNVMVQAAMGRDFSWDAAASEYIRLYRSLAP